MKKISLILACALCVSACTSKEQDQKIKSFWAQQIMEVEMWAMQKMMSYKFGNQPALPPDFLKTAQDWKTQAAAGLSSQPMASTTDSAAVKAPTAKAAAKSTATAPAAAPAQPLRAQLFLSNSCGWCNKLKRSGFIEKFKEKYEGEVELKVYEVHTTEGRTGYSRALKKHQLSGGVPLLIIGGSNIQGYADNLMELADEKVRLEFKKLGRTPGETSSGPSVVSITLEDAEILGPAPAADKEYMKTYLSNVRDNNESTLNSLKSMFPKSVWNQGMVIITNTENSLKDLANKSSSFADFAAEAEKLETQQQEQIDELVRKNTNKIRPVK